MKRCRLDALALALLTACASTPHPAPPAVDPYEAQVIALRYEVSLVAGTVAVESVEVDDEDFEEAMGAMGAVLRNVPRSTDPKKAAQWLVSRELETHLLAEVRSGRVLRLSPLEENSPLESLTADEVKREYARVCHELNAGADCLGLMADGAALTREDVRTLALAMALRPALEQVKHSLKETVEPRAFLSTLVWTCAVYLTLWLLPEPVSKGVAAVMTVSLIAWLGVDTLWSLMDAWAGLVADVEKATRFAHVRAASERLGRGLGENAAKVLVLLAGAALGGTAAKFAQKLPKLPGFQRAAANAEAQGVRLEQAARVEQAVASSEGSFSVLARSSAGEGAVVQGGSRSVATLIRHRLGNRQVFIHGQRWHVPANRSLKEIPAKDPVGDQLEAAAREAAKRWSPEGLSGAEREAIREAMAQGRYWRAHHLERMARGKFVESQLKRQFTELRWNARGVDAVDPVTGYKYEILSGTKGNMELHGRRMAEEFFRLIPF